MAVTKKIKHLEHRLGDSLKSGFDRIWRPAAALFGHTPPANANEQNEQVILRVDLPGVEKKDLELQVEEGILTLRAQRRYSSEKQEEGYYHCESYFGTLERSFLLPESADTDRIEAKLDNGVLFITIPYDESKRPRAISVQ